jgi:RNA polymerase sigma-70 factor (ECF subfamily)
MPQARQMLERVFREEYGRIVATLIRLSGSFDLAEESLKEAFASAITNWEENGTPGNPGAWLTTEPSLFEEAVEYPDDRLRLIFTCCHPSLSNEAQVALTLRTLGGLATSEIARAFLLPELTLAQRLERAKNKIRIARIPYRVPVLEVLPQRLASVQAVIYLIFNEGYAATSGDSLMRRDLCAEAIRLGRVLCQLMPPESHGPENLGLLPSVGHSTIPDEGCRRHWCIMSGLKQTCLDQR